ATVPRRPIRPTHSRFNSEVPSSFPTISKEEIRGSSDPRHIALSAKFYVLVEIAHQRVSYGDAGRLWVAGVTEGKLAVLIDRCAGAGRSMNDEVILPGSLHKNPGFDCVVADDLGSVVGPGIDEPRP